MEPEVDKIKRDVLSEAGIAWHILKYQAAPKMRLEMRCCHDPARKLGEQNYVDYIVTNKHNDDINWDEKYE